MSLTTPISFHRLDGNALDVISNTSGLDSGNTYVSGKINQAASFDGTNDSITTINQVSTYSFIQNTGVFTISFWAKRSAISVTKSFMGNTPTSTEKGFFMQGLATNAIRIAVLRGGGNTVIDSTSATNFFTDTNYHLITIVGNGTNITFYKDLTSFAGSSSMGTLSTGDSTRVLTLGQISSFASQYYAGELDAVAFWNRALTLADITEYYNGGNGIQYPFVKSNFFAFM